MSKHIDIRTEIKQAMIAKDATRLSVLRGLLSAFTNQLVATKRKPDEELSDDEVMEVISKQARQRKDSIEQFEKGGRADLAESEKTELHILEAYLPEQMSKGEIEDFIKQKQAETGSTDPAKKGQFMGMVMKDLKGKADSAVVKEVIDSLFS
ncbi:MAG: hypothetical protein JWL80_413 [Parcubacteria group bacterium]|nr:hypothetical protein [Parcubacteria group bacterium]